MARVCLDSCRFFNPPNRLKLCRSLGPDLAAQKEETEYQDRLDREYSLPTPLPVPTGNIPCGNNAEGSAAGIWRDLCEARRRWLWTVTARYLHNL